MAQVNRSNPRHKLTRREWLQKTSTAGLYLALAELGMPALLAARPAAHGARFIPQSQFSLLLGSSKSRNRDGSRSCQRPQSLQFGAQQHRGDRFWPDRPMHWGQT